MIKTTPPHLTITLKVGMVIRSRAFTYHPEGPGFESRWPDGVALQLRRAYIMNLKRHLRLPGLRRRELTTMQTKF